MEFYKRNEYFKRFANFYFWRTYDQKEIDLIEEIDGKLNCYEFKWKKKKAKKPQEFFDNYQNSDYFIVDSDNYLEFLTR